MFWARKHPREQHFEFMSLRNLNSRVQTDFFCEVDGLDLLFMRNTKIKKTEKNTRSGVEKQSYLF